MGLAVKLSGLALLAGLCVHQQRTFVSDQTLWENAVERAPWAVRPRINLADAYRRDGQPDLAITQLQDAETLLPYERWRNDYHCAIAHQALLMAAFGHPVCHTSATSSLCSC